MDEIFREMDSKRVYPSGAVNGSIDISNNKTWPNDDFKRGTAEDFGDEEYYEQEFVKEEQKRYFEPNLENKPKKDDLSAISSVMCSELEAHHNIDIYQRYTFAQDASIKKDLPIDTYKEKITSMIATNQITVIEGPTGCGKTTQVPQMILDQARARNEYCKIVVTQPRKIATINLAKRVCQERGWTMGSVCGYQIGLEKAISPDQIITYVTIGVLLQKIIHAKSLKEYTHIVIDEIHERSQEMDFLLLLVRKYMFLNSPTTKVVLMSATINATEFAHYFRRRCASRIIPAPIITVAETLNYQKVVFYLDNLHMCITKMPLFDIDKPTIPQLIWDTFAFLLKIFDKIDKGDKFGTVLVFLPGLREIEDANELLLESQKKCSEIRSKWEIVPLHSSFPNDEQAKAFLPRKDGWRRIILSTNITESSVTVPDTSYVIDFCMSKSLSLDPITNYSCLKLHWASHMNCEQRAGRVGRTCDGRVYRLVSYEFYKKEMSKTIQPEIIQAPLETVVLQAKLLQLSETPAQILALAMKPPNLSNIQKTLWKLKELGGLLKTCRGNLTNVDGDITFLGTVMAHLPIDVRLAKMIVLGHLFSCLDETIIIAAGASIQNIFSLPFQKKLESYRKQLLWADNSNSDLIAILNVYTVWQNMKRENAFQTISNEIDWCMKNYLRYKSLREWNLLIADLKSRLQRMQILALGGVRKVILSAPEKATVLKIVMAGAFYPHFFLKRHKFDSELEAIRTTGLRDPFSTVYFTGMESRQPVHLYANQIRKMLQDNKDVGSTKEEQDSKDVGSNKEERDMGIHVGTDGISEKIYITFRNDFQPDSITVNVTNREQKIMQNTITKIPNGVYEAIKKRQLKYPFVLKVIQADKAWKFALRIGSNFKGFSSVPFEEPRCAEEPRNCFSSVTYCALPSPDAGFISIYITGYIDVSHFWAQNATEESDELLRKIFHLLNDKRLTQVGNEPLKVGKLYAVRFKTDKYIYRARIMTIAGRLNQVLFIDYGNVEQVEASDIFYLPQTPHSYMNPLAFQCTLHGIKPSYKKNPLGVWSEQANGIFKQLTEGLILYGEIYSIVKDVVELTLYRSQTKGASINSYFLQYGLGEICTPALLSIQNHEARETNRQLGVETPAQTSTESYSSDLSPDDEKNLEKLEKILSNSSLCHEVHLKGPYSPLEVNFFCCSEIGSHFEVSIDSNSINCVTLDTEPESDHDRLLVAGYVGQNAAGNRLSLRQTTLMPNVIGLPVMLAALFCPTMKVCVAENNLAVGEVLFGLGCDPESGKPLYEAHDMILKADTELTEKEIEMINTIRYLMNNGLRSLQGNYENNLDNNRLYDAQMNIKRCLFELLNMERIRITCDHTYAVNQDRGWMRNTKLDRLDPMFQNVDGDVWELLSFVKLPQLNENQRKILKNLDDIAKIIHNVIKFEVIACELCEEGKFTRAGDLRWHMVSDEHIENLRAFEASYKLN